VPLACVLKNPMLADTRDCCEAMPQRGNLQIYLLAAHGVTSSARSCGPIQRSGKAWGEPCSIVLGRWISAYGSSRERSAVRPDC
jgi:hypothetical protein